MPIVGLDTAPVREVETTPFVRHSNDMNKVLDIGKLTRAEKLRAMEELREDLSRPEDECPSPEWHSEVLREREEDLQAGTDAFVSWEDAKRILRERAK